MKQPWLPTRIWRCGDLDFNKDEILQAPAAYTDDELKRIASHGFTGVWLRGKMAGLMQSTVLPELNDPQRDERIAAMQTVIDRGNAVGIGTWLYFNEPLAPLSDHPVFKAHPDIAGRTHRDLGGERDRTVTAICTSTEKGRRFFREAVQTVFDALPGLAGVILITSSEFPTHCWSKYRRKLIGDGEPDDVLDLELGCSRCAPREPAEIVGELVTDWADAAKACAQPPRVVAWNWSWSFWYDEPQQEVIDQLPDGIDLQLDFERGDERDWRGRTIEVDEYSLGFVGPSRRFKLSAQAAAKRGMGVFAKMQLGTTHEIASVPNLPVIGNLHAKFVSLADAGATGALGCWNFGCDLTLNTYAVKLFADDPARYRDRDAYFADIAAQYLGVSDHAPLATAWDAFAQAMLHYPFSIGMLYMAPINYAPAYPFKLTYEGRPFGASWLYHEPLGDNPENCLGHFAIEDVTAALYDMARLWRGALPGYVAALAQGSQREHCEAESGVAQMIGLQWQSAANLFAWHQWRGSGRDAVDDTARAILNDELQTLTAALPLVDADKRLGYHQEAQYQWYGSDSIRAKRAGIEKLLTQ